MHFAPGYFYGDTRLSFSSHDISVTHRIADRLAEEVAWHTHTDAHFVLVTGGEYVSVAEGYRSQDLPILVFNPAGTTHRDHFERGLGSFFAISLEPVKTTSLPAGCLLPDGPVHLSRAAQHSLALRIAAFSNSHGSGLALDALVHRAARQHGPPNAKVTEVTPALAACRAGALARPIPRRSIHRRYCGQRGCPPDPLGTKLPSLLPMYAGGLCPLSPAGVGRPTPYALDAAAGRSCGDVRIRRSESSY